jgi:hypothetical protein
MLSFLAQVKKKRQGRLQLHTRSAFQYPEKPQISPRRFSRQAGGKKSRISVSLLGEYCQQQITVTRTLCGQHNYW